MNEYLVQYGGPAFVGRFAAGDAFGRGDRVIVRTPRGVELGTVLCPADPRFVGGTAADGDVIRPASHADNNPDGRELLADADRRAAASGLPVNFLDAELLFDGVTAVLHALPWGDADLTPLLDDLSAAFGRAVRLHDVRQTPAAADPPAKGCGKPGCGSEGGGCSTGGCGTSSCSRAAVKSADDLTAYFADLRGKMEADTAARRTPLH